MDVDILENQVFLEPRLTGKRFEDHTIPLEVFKDFSALEELIVELAKHAYKQENLDRQRLPKGFTKNISLKLSGVEEGSAIPKIVLDIQNQDNASQYKKYFDNSKEMILKGVSAANDMDGQISQYIPEEYLSYFDKIGRSLKDDEALELSPKDTNNKAILDKSTRKLLLSSSRLEEITEEIVVRGKIFELDQKENIFTIEGTDGLVIKAPVNSQHKSTILEAFNNYVNGVKVLIQCLGTFNRNDKLIRIETVEHISLLDINDVPSRIDELKSLKDGWLDGIGKAPTLENLNWLSTQFDNYALEDMPLPLVFPTEEGNIQMEWNFNLLDISLEIDLITQKAQLHILNLGTKKESLHDLDLAISSSWKELAEFIYEATKANV